MKKVLFVLLAVVMVVSTLVVSTSAAEIPTDGLIGHFKFEGNLNNEVAADAPGELMGKQFGESMYALEELYWVHNSVEGLGFAACEGDGFNTYVNPGDGDFTIALWILETQDPGIVPYVWYGQQTQSPEAWIGIWNVPIVDAAGAWEPRNTLSVGSNDAAVARLGIVPETPTHDLTAGIVMPWTHVAITATQVKGADGAVDTYDVTMYINGAAVGSNTGLPDPYTGDPETNGDYIYVNGVNAWPDNMSRGAMDDLLIYNKALSADEISALYGSYPTDLKSYTDYDDFYTDCMEVGGSEGGDDTTAEPDDTTAEPDDTTAEPDDSAAGTDEGTGTTADTSEEEGGCGSAMGAAAAIVALTSVLGCAIVKKH